MDLKTKYLGLELSSPLVVSASPLSESIENIIEMEKHGASAVVLYSLFEEQLRYESLEAEAFENMGTELSPEAESYFPNVDEYKLGPEQYLNHIKAAKEAVNIPIIASLNAGTLGGWIEYAKKIEEAGADALELNIYNIFTDFDMPGEDVENAYLEIVRAIKKTINIPVAVKLSPYFSNIANMAKRFDAAGADALVLFNRFYQPDINLEKLEVEPSVMLSHSGGNRLSMRWIALLADHLKCDLAATSGVHTAEDALKMMMAGAKVTEIASVLLKNGIPHLSVLKQDIENWMKEHEYESIEQMQGSMSQKKIDNPSAYERAQYMKTLNSYVIN